MVSLHGRTVAGVPRWAMWAAYGAAATVLPSGLWRLLATDGVGVNLPLLDEGGQVPEGHGPVLFSGWWYVIGLTVISEALAFLSVGLVATWGEVVPRWVPILGGRRIPVFAVVVPAGLGAAILTLGTTYTLIMFSMGRMVNGTEGSGLHLNGWQSLVFSATYLPLLAWGPLLGAVTIHYYRRRRRT